MRVKSCFLAVSLCCTLPFVAQGVDLEPYEPDPPPTILLRSISPVIVNAGTGMLTLYFMSDLGGIYVLLQEVTGEVKYNQPIDTSVQNQAELTAPSGTYILTIIDAAGNVIQQANVVIP